MADADPINRTPSPFTVVTRVRERLTEAVLGQSGLNHPALAAEVRRQFGSTSVETGALVREPVVEAALPYVAGDVTLGELAGHRIHRAVVDALTEGGADRLYRFDPTLKPYRHQLAAWDLLTAEVPQSVLVSSGTGSGKTECFLVPLLHDLASEAEKVGRLSGVRAIALYPLNALIASQEKRLREWTRPFDGRIRFGLYNGLMPEDLKAKDGKASPEQVLDRQTLRSDPPPILVTNVTMLEYMTVRKQDRKLIEASRGKLRWIVLDEAHSYVGSAAAEIALLIRRVLLAFDVKPENVRFVATSATIGEGEETEAKLKRFLRDVAGVPDAQVHVVVGHREQPKFPAPAPSPALAAHDLSEPAKLASNPVVQDVVRKLSKAPMSWTDVSGLVAQTGQPAEDVVRAIARGDARGEPIAPLRVQGFLRAVPGLWACLNASCEGKPAGDWAFGAVLSERSDRCPHCRSLVLEIACCAECGEPFLETVERDGHLVQTRHRPTVDEFAEGGEAKEAPPGDEDAPPAPEDDDPRPDIERLLSTRPLGGGRPLHVVAHDGTVRDTAGEDTRQLSTHDRGRPEACPACDATARAEDLEGALLRPFRFGAPFLIGNAAPVLLEGVPPRPADADSPAPPPSDGRQLLSFTDSRQGTARFAAALQSSAERNHVRAVIYHAIQETLRPDPNAASKVADLDAAIARYERATALGVDMSDELAKARAERERALSPAGDGLPWAKLRDVLASRPEIVHWMRKVWGGWDERFRKSEQDFAEFLLLRELGRRTRRANSLETFGLARLRFSHLATLKTVPAAFAARGRSVDDWRDYLALILTAVIRNYFAIKIDRPNVHWLIRSGVPRVLVGPEAEATSRADLRWPAAGRSPNPGTAVRLLHRVLDLDPRDADDRREINDILSAAWHALLPLFQEPGSGSIYRLDLEKAHVAPVTTGYVCPVSRRILDTTFVRISPYGLRGTSRFAGQPCESVELPVHPNPYLLPQNGGREVVESWLSSDGKVEALRARGLWGDLQDRIALMSPYLRAAEHSAQQPPARLRRYEGEFANGQINILACSTTMEMGVDIGSVSSVMMTNVPPSIVNYRQRVGRAGRRGQGFAASLTYTRDTPLDREAFRDPVAYLTRRIEAPKVTLDSSRIVQRHVNAMLLAAWFAEAGGEALKAKAGDFFGCPADIGGKRVEPSPAVHFCRWVEQPSTLAQTAASVETLVRGSDLQGSKGLYAAAREAVAVAEQAFFTEWDAIQSQAAGMEREAAKKGLGFTLRRMCGEYLLSELSDRGVLPGHGFPTAVVSFVNKDEPDRDDEPAEGSARRRSYPSRNLDIAIRDYAPGAEVVVDGLVYRSAGVTLNWRRPAGEGGVKDVQSIKWFWSCEECGAADTARLMPERCGGCGASLPPTALRRFLEPAGFTADMREEPHADIEAVAYIEPEPEQVVARGSEWKPFADPTAGRLRASHDGLVFYASQGGKLANGYAICLECGRAEAEHIFEAGANPLDSHRPLRGTAAATDGICAGNAQGFSILREMSLGHDVVTDVVEVQPSRLVHLGGAWAFGSALREALANRLGIGAGEMGLSVVRRVSALAAPTHSIFIYDRAAGGAGFAPRLVEFFSELVADAERSLRCEEAGCLRACSACVLTGDLHAQAEIIDRRAALSFIETELGSLARPDDVDAVVPGAVLVADAADDLTALSQARAGRVVLWAADPFDPAALGSPRLRALLESANRHGRSVSVVIDPPALDAMDAAQRLALHNASVRWDLSLALGSPPQHGNGAVTLASFDAEGGPLHWSTRDGAAAVCGERWGLGASAPIVRHGGGLAASRSVLDPSSLLPKSGTKFIEVRGQLDGGTGDFGKRFAAWVRAQLSELSLSGEGLRSVSYTDRYVSSPIVTRLVVDGIGALVSEHGSEATEVKLCLAPLRSGAERSPYRVQHDWQIEDDRVEVIAGIAEPWKMLPIVEVARQPHSRRLVLEFTSKTVELILDQGFGFLRPVLAKHFDFQVAPAAQARALRALNLLCQAEGATYLVIHVR